MRLPTLMHGMAAGLALLAGLAQAADYRSAAGTTVLYDAPSDRAKPLYVIRRKTPLEVVVNVDKWVKVRDMEGSITWIRAQDLAAQRTLIVRVPQARIYQRPAEDAPVAFELARNVVVDMLEPPAMGWIKIRHESGDTGYVHVADVWGF